jgi:hypothetical protein
LHQTHPRTINLICFTSGFPGKLMLKLPSLETNGSTASVLTDDSAEFSAGAEDPQAVNTNNASGTNTQNFFDIFMK